MSLSKHEASVAMAQSRKKPKARISRQVFGATRPWSICLQRAAVSRHEVYYYLVYQYGARLAQQSEDQMHTLANPSDDDDLALKTFCLI